MHSCLYTGQVRHRRFEPSVNEFRYAISFLYLDLDELDDVVRRLPFLKTGPWGICSLRFDERLPMTRPADAPIRSREELRDAIKRIVRRETGAEPNGPIRWLTLWGSMGLFFTPVSFYFCFSADGETVESIVAEVSNTPWRERHCYVLWHANRLQANHDRSSGRMQFAHDKQFHVSPFLDLGLTYRWGLNTPNEALSIHLEACRDENPMLDATLNLKRTELTRAAWLRSVARYPIVPLRVLSGIYIEAFRLWKNKVPFFAHPRKQSAPDVEESSQVDPVNRETLGISEALEPSRHREPHVPSNSSTD